MTIRRSLRAGAGSDLLIVRSIRTNDSYVAADVILNFRKKPHLWNGIRYQVEILCVNKVSISNVNNS